MSTMKTITVIGVTGKQGRAVATNFLNTPGWRVRGVTRSKASSTAKHLANASVEFIEANFDDGKSEALSDAFRNTHVIFANTDFFAMTKYSDLQELLALRYKGQALNETCMAHEIQQGKDIIDAIARISVESSSSSDPPILESLVLSTLSHASKPSNGQIQGLLHFDSKAAIRAILRTEYPDLAAKTRYLQVGFYVSNVLDPVLLPRKALDGVYEFHWANVTPSIVLTAICPERDTGVFVQSLAVAAPSGTKLLAEVDQLTMDEFLRTWSEVTGRPARLMPISTRELEAIVEPNMPSFRTCLPSVVKWRKTFSTIAISLTRDEIRLFVGLEILVSMWEI